MRHFMTFSRPRRIALIASSLALVGGTGWLAYAQVSGERGIAPIAASTDIEVMDINVDVHADSGTEARDEAWKQAAAKAWEKINGPQLSDLQLNSMVSAIIIQREQLGPKRYIATLGVVFDRQRASGYLGRNGEAQRSAPMLLLPVTVTAGSAMIYEQRNPWQRAWAEFQAGTSRVNYVRPSGAGGDLLLLTYGQTGRRSRVWWRGVLDDFGASDVLIPIANLHYTYPGGPVQGTFTARHGPDNEVISTFKMRADSPEKLPAMLEQAVKKFDVIFQQALSDGLLKPDPTLNVGQGTLDPAIARLVELGRRLKAQDAARERGEAASDTAALPTSESDGAITAAPVNNPPPAGSVALYTVQVATPDPASYDAALSAVRGTPGVKSAGVRSTAIGGTSVMTISYEGSIGDLAAALRSRGFNVSQGGAALSISR